MARAVLALGESLQAEVTCSVCLELFSEPVITECGHNFCGRCLAAVLGVPPRPAACPQCRAPVAPGSLRPNRSLGAVAGLAEALGDEARRPRCPRHGEALSLFCESCRGPLCPRCREGSPHRHHRARPAEEAARELRETLQDNLDFLQKEKEDFKPEGEKQSDVLLGKVASERQRLRNTFEQLQRFLQEQEGVLLTQLDQAHRELTEEQCQYVSSVSERTSLLDTLIAEIEKKRDQPVVEFLMDVGKTLSSPVRDGLPVLEHSSPEFCCCRGFPPLFPSWCWVLADCWGQSSSPWCFTLSCEAAKAPIPEPVSPELQRTLESLSETSQLVVDAVAKFKVDLLSKIDRERGEFLELMGANEGEKLSRMSFLTSLHRDGLKPHHLNPGSV
ncbi:E3 ubiquitin-protein ligase TRIM7-like isoform X3 [Athene noctua]|uniref:E3 ubiquitin-protein ligase TRIM7-like isoform X3 n=1 Tax=Athene noctua TaxID=126797 RepID=UPI003EBB92FB